MEELFRDYWWLMFPLAWIVGGAFSSFFRYRRQKQTLDLIRTYADRGQEPPEALVKMAVVPAAGEDGWERRCRRPNRTRAWSHFGLFLAMAAGFGVASQVTDYDGDGNGLLVVAVIMGAIAVWALVNALTQPRDPN